MLAQFYSYRDTNLDHRFLVSVLRFCQWSRVSLWLETFHDLRSVVWCCWSLCSNGTGSFSFQTSPAEFDQIRLQWSQLALCDHVKVGLLFFVAFTIVLRFGTDLRQLGPLFPCHCPDFQVQAWLKKMRWARGIWSPLFSTLLLDCRGRHRQLLLWMLSIRRWSMSGMLLYEGIISCCIFTWWLHLLRIEAAREESVAGHVRLVHCGLSLKYFAFLVCSTTSWGATALPITQCGAKVSLSGSVAMLGSREPNRRFLQQPCDWAFSQLKKVQTPTLSKDKIREHFVLILLAHLQTKVLSH